MKNFRFHVRILNFPKVTGVVGNNRNLLFSYQTGHKFVHPKDGKVLL